MICPICGSSSRREWKHCCRDGLIICSSCCRECEYADRTSTIGGLMCRWQNERLTEEEKRELNSIGVRIARVENALLTQKRMGWDSTETEAHLDNLMCREAELRKKQKGGRHDYF